MSQKIGFHTLAGLSAGRQQLLLEVTASRGDFEGHELVCFHVQHLAMTGDYKAALGWLLPDGFGTTAFGSWSREASGQGNEKALRHDLQAVWLRIADLSSSVAPTTPSVQAQVVADCVETTAGHLSQPTWLETKVLGP